MRIHTDKLTSHELVSCLQDIDAVGITKCEPHGSRSHRQAYEVNLRGYGARHARPANSGTYGASDDYAATYDDWGLFLAVLFELDPNAFAGPYKGSEGFHERTNYDYATTSSNTAYWAQEVSK